MPTGVPWRRHLCCMSTPVHDHTHTHTRTRAHARTLSPRSSLHWSLIYPIFSPSVVHYKKGHLQADCCLDWLWYQKLSMLFLLLCLGFFLGFLPDWQHPQGTHIQICPFRFCNLMFFTKQLGSSSSSSQLLWWALEEAVRQEREKKQD